MKAHAPKQQKPQTETSPRSSLIARRASGSRAAPGSSHLDAEGRDVKPVASPANGFAHDFSRIPLRSAATLRLQTKLTVNAPGDAYEQEADRVSEKVMRMSEPRLQRACACGATCGGCRKERPGEEHKRLQTKRVGPTDSGQTAAPPVVHEVLASPGQLIDASTRAFMEPRFGHDLGHVRVHTDERAAESARAVNALAYTVGSDIVFDRGQYAPGTQTGRRLLAHELSHVEQQSGAAAASLQRACRGDAPGGNGILSDKEDDYKKAVKAGTYCRDTGITGVFHSGTCYREVPPKGGFPAGDQVCFDGKTGRCAEDSPDIVSAVEGTNADGSCNLSFLRSAGHFAEDLFPSEPEVMGLGFGLLAGSALGYAGSDMRLAGAGMGSLVGAAAGLTLGAWSRPVGGWLRRRGHVPFVGASFGLANPFPNLVGDATWQARLYVGTAKRDRAILRIMYPELRLGVTLVGEARSGEPGGSAVGPSALTSLVAGVRIDPGPPGGYYVSFFGGPAVAVGSADVGVGTEAGFAFGHRWRWFGVSAHATYLRDPTREPGNDKQLAIGFGVELGPEKPQEPEKKPTASPDAGVLSQEVAGNIRAALEQRVSPEALLPSHLRIRLRQARKAAEMAGPEEEAALIKKREAAESDAAEFDAHDIAFDLAVKMEQARRGGREYVKLNLWQYGFPAVSGDPVGDFVVGEIERIALIIRKHLPDQAAGVNTILVVFRWEQAAVQQQIKLPGWKPPQLRL